MPGSAKTRHTEHRREGPRFREEQPDSLAENIDVPARRSISIADIVAGAVALAAIIAALAWSSTNSTRAASARDAATVSSSTPQTR